MDENQRIRVIIIKIQNKFSSLFDKRAEYKKINQKAINLERLLTPEARQISTRENREVLLNLKENISCVGKVNPLI